MSNSLGVSSTASPRDRHPVAEEIDFEVAYFERGFVAS